MTVEGREDTERRRSDRTKIHSLPKTNAVTVDGRRTTGIISFLPSGNSSFSRDTLYLAQEKSCFRVLFEEAAQALQVYHLLTGRGLENGLSLFHLHNDNRSHANNPSEQRVARSSIKYHRSSYSIPRNLSMGLKACQQHQQDQRYTPVSMTKR